MTSIQEIKNLEKKLHEDITKMELEIENLRKTMEAKQNELSNIKLNRYAYQEKMFLGTYGATALQVRTDYVNLVKRCMQSCTSGHDVKIPGIVKNVYDHVCLLPKHYEACKPSQYIIEAFATVGQEIYIEPQPHIEYWGN